MPQLFYFSSRPHALNNLFITRLHMPQLIYFRHSTGHNYSIFSAPILTTFFFSAAPIMQTGLIRAATITHMFRVTTTRTQPDTTVAFIKHTIAPLLPTITHFFSLWPLPAYIELLPSRSPNCFLAKLICVVAFVQEFCTANLTQPTHTAKMLWRNRLVIPPSRG